MHHLSDRDEELSRLRKVVGEDGVTTILGAIPSNLEERSQDGDRRHTLRSTLQST